MSTVSTEHYLFNYFNVNQVNQKNRSVDNSVDTKKRINKGFLALVNYVNRKNRKIFSKIFLQQAKNRLFG